MCGGLSIYNGEFGRAAVYEIGRPLATHAHREGHLQFYVEGESAKAQVCAKPYALDSNSACAISPWQPHNFEPDKIGQSGIFLILYIKPEWFMGQGRHVNRVLHFGRTQLDVPAEIYKLVCTIVRQILNNGDTELLDDNLYELTHACFNQSWENRPLARIFSGSQNLISDFRVKNSMTLMTNNICGDIDFDTIAKEAGLSRPHFYKLFRQHTGITPNLYVNMIRLERSIEYLTQTELSVCDISSQLGFGSQSGFSRFFCANTGVAPTIYRTAAHLKQGRQQNPTDR